MSIKSLSLAALIASTALVGVANANPVSIGFQRANDAAITTVATGNGSAGVNGYDIGTYTISLSATGTPGQVNPNFGSNTLTIKSRTAGTIYLYATELNNNTVVPSFNIGLSNNPLSDTNVTEMVYGSSSNTAYALDTLLAQGTLAPGETLSMNAAYGLDTPYSLTEVYKISFAAGGGTVNATILEKANSVPEPVSLSLLGMGLAGLGLVRLRRKA